MGEGSLHPRPEGRGIRDPPRSQCNNPKQFLDNNISKNRIRVNSLPALPANEGPDGDFGKSRVPANSESYNHESDLGIKSPNKAVTSCSACGAEIGPGLGNYYGKFCSSCGPKTHMVKAAAKAHPEGFSTSELWEELAKRGRAPRKEHLSGMLQYLGYIEDGEVWRRPRDPDSPEQVGASA